ncbi:MAG: stage II sporulation protein R [Clostridiales bacterium]|nr:stage II sporulation protein R [Clostridiales bacterium]
MLKKYFTREYKFIIVSVLAGFVCSFIFCISARAYSHSVMNKITSEVFRFHILANSDSEEDQALKLALRDKILENYRDFLTSSPSKAETEDFFKSRLPEIENISEEFLKNEGCDYEVKAEVTKSMFPLRKYADVTLPGGNYDCLKISIGDAAGHNWWCVMFPPLCYVEGTYSEAEQGTYKNDLSEDVYSIILGDSESASPKVRLKLKITELWQNRQ